MNLFGDDEIKKWIRVMPPEFEEWLGQEFADGVSKLMAAEDLLSVGRFQGMLVLLATLKDLRKRS